MSFKVSCLFLILTVVGINCFPYQFGGSIGATSHSEAGASVGGEIGKNDEGYWGAKTKGNIHGDWTGGAGGGGYAGLGKPEEDPNANVTGAGVGGFVTAHVGGSTGGVAGGVIRDGKAIADASSVSSLDGSTSATGSGFLGTVMQKEAEYIGGYGRRANNMPAYGAYYGGQYGAPYGTAYGLNGMPPMMN